MGFLATAFAARGQITQSAARGQTTQSAARGQTTQSSLALQQSFFGRKAVFCRLLFCPANKELFHPAKKEVGAPRDDEYGEQRPIDMLPKGGGASMV